MSNDFSVKCFSHLTIVKISEFSHSPLGGTKTFQKRYNKKRRGERREISLKITSRVGHLSKIILSWPEIPALKPAQRVNPQSSMKYSLDTQAGLLRASSHPGSQGVALPVDGAEKQ